MGTATMAKPRVPRALLPRWRPLDLCQCPDLLTNHRCIKHGRIDMIARSMKPVRRARPWLGAAVGATGAG
jgi:hypothetical protein